MIIGKTFKFEAAHCLPGHEKCGRVHGHTYTLTVEVSGAISSESGMVMDYHALKSIVQQEVLDVLDHKCLNDVVTFVPTCEELVWYIFNILNRTIDQWSLGRLFLHSVQLQEGEGGYARQER